MQTNLSTRKKSSKSQQIKLRYWYIWLQWWILHFFSHKLEKVFFLKSNYLHYSLEKCLAWLLQDLEISHVISMCQYKGMQYAEIFMYSCKSNVTSGLKETDSWLYCFVELFFQSLLFCYCRLMSKKALHKIFLPTYATFANFQVVPLIYVTYKYTIQRHPCDQGFYIADSANCCIFTRFFTADKLLWSNLDIPSCSLSACSTIFSNCRFLDG